MTCFIGEMWYIVEREMWYIDSGLITTQHTTYYCYVTYDLCALYNVDLDLQNMLNHPDGVKAPKEILLLTLSTHRLRALKLCGWGFDKESPSLAYIDRLASDGLYARAAAVAVFTLRMGRAIALLNSGAAAAAAAATTTTQRPGGDSSGQSVGQCRLQMIDCGMYINMKMYREIDINTRLL